MWSLQQFTFSPIQENTYLLWNDHKEAIIIDPGTYYDEEKEELKNFISQNQLQPKFLLNTHCHLDHVFGEKFVSETWNLVPHIHKNEEQMFQLAQVSSKMYGLPFVNYAGPLHFITESDVIKLGDDVLNILFTPGHSPGHVCFYCAEQHFIIGGDVLFQGSIGRTDLPFGDFSQLIESIQTKLLVLPDETIVYSGHGPATTIGQEKKTNPFLV